MKLILFFIVIVSLTFSCAHDKTHQRIKERVREISGHTSKEDEYWNELAFYATDKNISIMNVLENHNKALYNQILKDAQDPYLAMFWGMSVNFDSGAQEQIIDDKIIGDLQSVFNIKNDNKVIHAGVAHTYGYLFSTINTPYGYKRKRWIDHSLNSGFDLSQKSFSPETLDGGLLSNVTYFAGMLAFREKEALSLLKNVSNEFFTYYYESLNILRLEEEIKDYILVTTLVKNPTKMKELENDYLLIYSTQSKLTKKEALITVFPVNAKTYEQITNSKTLGANQKITLRYNAYLPKVGKNFIGTRKIIKD